MKNNRYALALLLAAACLLPAAAEAQSEHGIDGGATYTPETGNGGGGYSYTQQLQQEQQQQLEQQREEQQQQLEQQTNAEVQLGLAIGDALVDMVQNWEQQQQDSPPAQPENLTAAPDATPDTQTDDTDLTDLTPGSEQFAAATCAAKDPATGDALYEDGSTDDCIAENIRISGDAYGQQTAEQFADGFTDPSPDATPSEGQTIALNTPDDSNQLSIIRQNGGTTTPDDQPLSIIRQNSGPYPTPSPDTPPLIRQNAAPPASSEPDTPSIIRQNGAPPTPSPSPSPSIIRQNSGQTADNPSPNRSVAGEDPGKFMPGSPQFATATCAQIDPDTGQPVFDPSNCATNVQAITSPQSFTVASTGFSNFSAAPTAGPITQSGLPAGCAFFTRPAVDEDGTRLNYWSEGSYVCYRGEGYLCDGDPRHWVDRGICLAPSYDAVALECSGLNTAVYEGDPKTVCNTGGAGEISAKTESDPDSTPNH